jgi:hypothetical protein
MVAKYNTKSFKENKVTLVGLLCQFRQLKTEPLLPATDSKTLKGKTKPHALEHVYPNTAILHH